MILLRVCRHAVARRGCWRAGRALSVDADVQDKSAKSADIEIVDSGAARIDFGRTFRTGVPEVIFGEGKSTEHLLEIFTTMAAREHRADGGGPAHAPVMATRVSAEKHGALLAAAEAAAAADADAASKRPRRPCDLTTSSTTPRRASSRCGARRAPAAAADKRGARAAVSAGTSDHPISEERAVALELSGCTVERVYTAASRARPAASQLASCGGRRRASSSSSPAWTAARGRRGALRRPSSPCRPRRPRRASRARAAAQNDERVRPASWS